MTNHSEKPAIVNLLYDKKTGRIVHKHTSYNVAKDEYGECGLKDLIELIQDDHITMNRVTDRDVKNLDVLILNEIPAESLSDLMVDVKTKQIIKRPKIKLSTDKREIAGDGKDSTIIHIEIVDEDDKLMRGFSGTIQVSTSRGKLSAPKGLVEINDGKGTIELTSINETVSRVEVTAQSFADVCRKGVIELQFV